MYNEKKPSCEESSQIIKESKPLPMLQLTLLRTSLKSCYSLFCAFTGVKLGPSVLIIQMASLSENDLSFETSELIINSLVKSCLWPFLFGRSDPDRVNEADDNSTSQGFGQNASNPWQEQLTNHNQQGGSPAVVTINKIIFVGLRLSKYLLQTTLMTNYKCQPWNQIARSNEITCLIIVTLIYHLIIYHLNCIIENEH